MCFFFWKNNVSCSRSLKERAQYMFFLIFILFFFCSPVGNVVYTLSWLKSQFSFWILLFFSFYLQIKPLHDTYLNEVSSMIWEQLNRFWAESYEACKASSQKRAKNLMESRRKFQVSKSVMLLSRHCVGKWHRKWCKENLLGQQCKCNWIFFHFYVLYFWFLLVENFSAMAYASKWWSDTTKWHPIITEDTWKTNRKKVAQCQTIPEQQKRSFLQWVSFFCFLFQVLFLLFRIHFDCYFTCSWDL